MNDSLNAIATRFNTIEEKQNSLENEMKTLRPTFSTPTSGSESGGQKRNRLTPIALQVMIVASIHLLVLLNHFISSEQDSHNPQCF